MKDKDKIPQMAVVMVLMVEMVVECLRVPVVLEDLVEMEDYQIVLVLNPKRIIHTMTYLVKLLNKSKIKRIKKRNLYRKPKTSLNSRMTKLVICPIKEENSNSLESSVGILLLGRLLLTEIIPPRKVMTILERMERELYNQLTN